MYAYRSAILWQTSTWRFQLFANFWSGKLTSKHNKFLNMTRKSSNVWLLNRWIWRCEKRDFTLFSNSSITSCQRKKFHVQERKPLHYKTAKYSSTREVTPNLTKYSSTMICGDNEVFNSSTRKITSIILIKEIQV